MFSLRYLPLARMDLANAVSYISEELKSPQAAEAFINALEKAVLRLREFPFSCRIYPLDGLEDQYHLLIVKNYCIFYTVDEAAKIVEISRVLCARMDFSLIEYE